MADFIIPKNKDFAFTVSVIAKDSFLPQDLTALDTSAFKVFSTIDATCVCECPLTVPIDEELTPMIPAVLPAEQEVLVTVAVVGDNSTTYSIVVDGTYYSFVSEALSEQKDIITFTTASDTTYSFNVNATPVTYTTNVVATQSDRIEYVYADSTTYAVIINGAVASFDTLVGDTITTIRDGLVTAINASFSMNGAVTATVDGNYVVVTADVPGAEGSYTITTDSNTAIVPLVTAIGVVPTTSEIQAGLISSCNTNPLINGTVTAASYSAGISITAVVGGLAGAYAIDTPVSTTIIPSTVAGNTTATEIAAGLTEAMAVSIVAATDNLDGTLTLVGPASYEAVSVVTSSNMFTTALIEASEGKDMIPAVTTDYALNGKLEGILVAAETDKLDVTRGPIEDNYYLKSIYQATVDVTFTDSTLPINVLIDRVLVSPTGTVCV